MMSTFISNWIDSKFSFEQNDESSPLWQLLLAERELLSLIKSCKYIKFFMPINIEIDNVVKFKNVIINTLVLNHIDAEHKHDQNSTNIPLVMIHGFGSGLASFYKNFGDLSQNRPIFAFDLIGFGASSRIKFPNDTKIVEKIFIESIEQWRLAMGLNKFVLIGHSMGGFLSALYAMKYPKCITNLIMIDPFGFEENIDDGSYEDSFLMKNYSLTSFIFNFIIKSIDVFKLLAYAGSYGQSLIAKLRPDISCNYRPMLTYDAFDRKINFYLDVDKFEKNFWKYNYYGLRIEPYGGIGFMKLVKKNFVAYHPLTTRLHEIPNSLPLIYIAGRTSNFGYLSAFKAKKNFPNMKVKLFQAGHHPHSEVFEEFNSYILDELTKIDQSSTYENLAHTPQ